MSRDLENIFVLFSGKWKEEVGDFYSEDGQPLKH